MVRRGVGEVERAQLRTGFSYRADAGSNPAPSATISQLHYATITPRQMTHVLTINGASIILFLAR